MEQQSYLSDSEFNPVLASAWKRFVNCVLDIIIFYILAAFILAGISYGFMYTISSIDSFQLVARLSFLMLFIILYFLSELLFNGRTIGKLVTGTRAVNENGTDMSPKTILFRSLSRIVPFEPFSAFGGRPWHDKWTGTYVIDVKKTMLNDPSFQ